MHKHILNNSYHEEGKAVIHRLNWTIAISFIQ
jgi:hypothetical protein